MKLRNSKVKAYFILVVSRIYCRTAFLILNAVLIHSWGIVLYGKYSSKIGIWLILQPFLTIGVSKCSAKLFTIYKKDVFSILAPIFIVCLIFIIGTSISTILILPIFAIELDLLDVCIIFQTLNYGYVITLQSIGRSLKKENYDYMISLVSGSFIIALSIICFNNKVSPITVIIIQFIFFFLLNLFVTRRFIGKYKIKNLFKPSIISIKMIVKESTIMGVSSILGNACFSGINLALNFYGLLEIAGFYNYILSIYSFFLAFWDYILMLIFPLMTKFRHRPGSSIIGKYSNRFMILAMSSTFLLLVAVSVLFYSQDKFFCLLVLLILLVAINGINEFMLVYFEATRTHFLFHPMIGSICGLMGCILIAFFTLPIFEERAAFFSLITAEYLTTMYLFICMRIFEKKEDNYVY